MAQYSQFNAYKALTRASLRSILKSPSSVIFTIAFPLVFIVAFGWIDQEDRFKKADIGLITDDVELASLLTSKAYWTIHELQAQDDPSSLLRDMDLDMILIKESERNAELLTTSQPSDHLHLISDLLTYQLSVSGVVPPPVTVQQIALADGASVSKRIDYILPGQLGFSLLAASVFGTAFVFFGLRNGNVLKRFFATPIRPVTLLLAEGSSRLIFQLFGALLLILIGYFFFDFSLPSGLLTIIGILLLSIAAIISFMSFGFIISGIARSESTVPPLANVIVLPQFILSDTFIPLSELPGFISKIAQFLPLTHFNQAIRLFSQSPVSQISWGTLGLHLLVIAIWGVLGYFAASRTFKWE